MDILSSLANIGFDWKVAIANLVNFIIVFILLNRFIFKPMKAKLEERRKTIEKGIEDAKIAESDRLMAEEAYKTRIVEAQGEANKLVAGAEVKGKEIVDEAKSKASSEAEKVLQEASMTLKEREIAMEREVRERTADLVIAGVEKILKEEIDVEKNKKIIHSVLENA